MKKKIFITAFMLTLMMPFSVLAENLTKDDLSAAFAKFGTACADYKDKATESGWTCTDDTSTYTVDDTKITIKDTDGTSSEIAYVINSDGTITFTQEMTFSKGLTYEQYKAKKESQIKLPAIAISAVAVARGVDLLDASAYQLQIILFQVAHSLNNGSSTTNSYVILADGVTGSSDMLTIPNSEFPNRILEVLPLDFPNVTYNDLFNADGETFGINSYKHTQTYTKVDDNSGKVTLTTIVDSNADFTKLEGSYAASIKNLEDLGDSFNKSEAPDDSDEKESEEKNPETSVLISKYSLFALAIILLSIVLLRKKAYFHKI